MLSNPKYLFFALATLLILSTLSSCAPLDSGQSSRHTASNADRTFQDLVLAKMPGYQLSAEFIGRRVQASDAYSISVTDGAVVGQDRDTVVINFIERFEENGSLPFRLYFRSGLPTLNSREYWRLDFSGCNPRGCVSQLPNSQFVQVTREDHARHLILSAGSEARNYEILRHQIDGVSYRASVRVYFDSRGRVLKYYVSSYREPLTSREAARGQRALPQEPLSIPTYRFARNVVLSNQAETWDPRFLQSEGVNRTFGL